jgi:hypothetical protein
MRKRNGPFALQCSGVSVFLWLRSPAELALYPPVFFLCCPAGGPRLLPPPPVRRSPAVAAEGEATQYPTTLDIHAAPSLSFLPRFSSSFPALLSGLFHPRCPFKASPVLQASVAVPVGRGVESGELVVVQFVVSPKLPSSLEVNAPGERESSYLSPKPYFSPPSTTRARPSLCRGKEDSVVI